MKNFFRILICLMIINFNLPQTYSKATVLDSLKKGIANSINTKETNLTSLNINQANAVTLNFSNGFPKTNIVSMGSKKFYVDMSNCVNTLKNKNIINNKNLVVKAVRTSQFKNNPKIARAVFEIGDGVEYKILYSYNKITFSFSKKVSETISNIKNDTIKNAIVKNDVTKNNNINKNDKKITTNITSSTSKTLTLKNVNVDKNSNKIEFEYSNGVPKVKELSASKKVILDMYGCTNGLATRNINVSTAKVDSIRTSQYQVSPKVTRVVLDLKDDCKKYKLSYGVNKLILIFDASENLESEPSNQGITKGIVTYLKDVDSVINISNLSSLKYNINDKTITFQLPINYNLNNIIGISDEYINSVQIINGKTFNTVKITLTKQISCYTKKSLNGVSLVIGNQNNNTTANLGGKVVVLDPGHGGTEPGASGNGIVEKKLNLEIALIVKQILEKNKIKVYMTRSDDSYYNKSTTSVREELISRAQYANTLNADFLVSIHTNSASSGAYGIETLYYPDNGTNKKTLQKGKINSKTLSSFIQDETIKATGAYNRGVISRPNLIILKYTNIVPVLVEVGFLSNTKEANALKTDEYKQKLAQGIANGIIKALNEE